MSEMLVLYFIWVLYAAALGAMANHELRRNNRPKLGAIAFLFLSLVVGALGAVLIVRQGLCVAGLQG